MNQSGRSNAESDTHISRSANDALGRKLEPEVRGERRDHVRPSSAHATRSHIRRYKPVSANVKGMTAMAAGTQQAAIPATLRQ
jgi:hypothetical protein